jgi:hypothetical protein
VIVCPCSWFPWDHQIGTILISRADNESFLDMWRGQNSPRHLLQTQIHFTMFV